MQDVRNASRDGAVTDDPRPLVIFGGLAILAGVVAAVGIAGRQLGLNVVVVGAVALIAVFVRVRPALDRVDASLVVVAAAPLSLALFRSAEWLIALEVTAALCSISVGAARARGWGAVIMAPVRALGGLHRGLQVALGPLMARVRPEIAWDVTPAVRGSIVVSLLLVVFGGLFISADAAFASLAERWLVPDIDVSLVPGRVILLVGSIALVGAVARLSPVVQDRVSPWSLPGAHQPSSFLSPTEWKVGLVVLDALFAAFVVVQLAVLFGGRTHVLDSAGLTYAQYARQGFFQLLIVAALTLGVIAIVVHFGGRDPAARLWLRVLLGLLCALTLVILASAFTRMNLYQEAYGFTRLRLLVDLSILWMAVVFGLVMAAGIAWKGRWLPRAVVAAGLVAVVGFGLYNPDARIADRNVERFRATGLIDLGYLAGLSTDAVPALMELPEPHRSCVIDHIVGRVDDPTGWSFNLSRLHAVQIHPRLSLGPEPRCRWFRSMR
jgi:hypothetical protein